MLERNSVEVENSSGDERTCINSFDNSWTRTNRKSQARTPRKGFDTRITFLQARSRHGKTCTLYTHELDSSQQTVSLRGQQKLSISYSRKGLLQRRLIQYRGMLEGSVLHQGQFAEFPCLQLPCPIPNMNESRQSR
jgi:hypothetical protein